MVATTLLSLSALLLLAGARALWCEGGPKMTAAGPTVRKRYSVQYDAEYGENVELFCSSHDSKYLTIRRYNYFDRNEENLPIMMNNATTILSLLKPEIGLYRYTCANSKIGCELSGFLIIHHTHAMHVSSPRVTFQIADGYDYDNYDNYFVPYGEDFQVICTGPEYETLHISLNRYNTLQTTEVNVTSVAYSARANRTGEFSYGCGGQNVSRHIQLVVDYFPEAHNFSCIYDENKFDCSWSPSSARTTFTMFYSDKIVCFSITGENNGGCVWKNYLKGRRLVEFDKPVFSVILETCNDFICNNETFTMHYNLITKLSPVYQLHVKSTSTRDVLLSWRYWCASYNPCSHRVEYRLSAFGETWQQAETSSVLCDRNGSCRFRLAPLYPDSKYEVRVSHRHKEATDDRLWSDPASVSVVTKPREECMCEASKGTSESITLREACEACLLGDHVDKKISALNELKIKLKRKRYGINGYIKRIKAIEATDSFPRAD